MELAPEGAVPALEDATGKLTLVDLYPGEIILSQRLLDPNVIAPDGRLALVVAEEEVLMAFPAQDLMSRIGVLKPGDHVDLLFSLEFPANRGLQAPAAGARAVKRASAREEERARDVQPPPKRDRFGRWSPARRRPAAMTSRRPAGHPAHRQPAGRADPEVCEGCRRHARYHLARARRRASLHHRAGRRGLHDRPLSDPDRGRPLTLQRELNVQLMGAIFAVLPSCLSRTYRV